MSNDAEIRHNARVRQLYHTLHATDRFISVEREVPYFKTSRLERLVGQADIITVDHDKLIYWEVKTGDPTKAHRKLKEQAQAWFSSKSRSPDLKPYFVSYNPRNEKLPVIGRFRRYHPND